MCDRPTCHCLLWGQDSRLGLDLGGLGGSGLGKGWSVYGALEAVEGADCAEAAAVEDVGVDHGGSDVLVSE